jgi:hypothetical protein
MKHSDGVLVLTAPKLETEQKRRIAITETLHAPEKLASDEEVIQKSYSDAYNESDWVETGKVAQDK